MTDVDLFYEDSPLHPLPKINSEDLQVPFRNSEEF